MNFRNSFSNRPFRKIFIEVKTINHDENRFIDIYELNEIALEY